MTITITIYLIPYVLVISCVHLTRMILRAHGKNMWKYVSKNGNPSSKSWVWEFERERVRDWERERETVLPAEDCTSPLWRDVTTCGLAAPYKKRGRLYMYTCTSHW